MALPDKEMRCGNVVAAIWIDPSGRPYVKLSTRAGKLIVPGFRMRSLKYILQLIPKVQEYCDWYVKLHPPIGTTKT